MFIAYDCYTVSECYADKSDAMYSFSCKLLIRQNRVV